MEEDLEARRQPLLVVEAEAEAEAEYNLNPNPNPKSKQVEQQLSVDEIMHWFVGGEDLGRAQLLQVVLVSFAWALDALHTMLAIFTDSDHEPDRVGASIVSEWGLTSAAAGLPASLYFVGCIFGAGVLGSLSDGVLGRRRTLLLSSSALSLLGFLTSAAPNFAVYAALRFAAGFARAGTGTTALVLATEAVPPMQRGQVGIMGFLFFMAGFASLPGLAYLTRRTSWRALYVVVSAISAAYTCAALPLSWDSPHWLVLRGRHADALRVLRGMARVNGRAVPETVVVAAAAVAAPPQGSVWGTAWGRRRLAAVMAGAAGTGVVYYGMPLNIGNLLVNVDVHASTLLNALMELPAIVIGAMLLPRLGRRYILCALSLACAALCAACSAMAAAAVEEAGTATFWRVAELASEVGAFLGVCVVFDVWYIFCMELFPTDVRSGAVASMGQAIMAGAAAGPLFVQGQGRRWAAFALFATSSLFSGLAALLLPETAGAPPSQTVEEQQLAEGRPQRQQQQQRLTLRVRGSATPLLA